MIKREGRFFLLCCAGFRFDELPRRPLLQLPHTAGKDWKRLRLHTVSRDHYDELLDGPGHLADGGFGVQPTDGNEEHATFELRSFGAYSTIYISFVSSIGLCIFIRQALAV